MIANQGGSGYFSTKPIDFDAIHACIAETQPGQVLMAKQFKYRWDNVVGYTSPSWSGFSVAAAYTLNGYGQESIANRGSGAVGDVRAVGVVPQYRNGPLFIGLNLQELRAKSTGVDATGTPVAVSYDGKKVRAYDLGGTYDLGFAKLAAGYGIRRADVADFSADTGAIDGKESKQWLIGATVPVSAAGKVLASFVRRTTERVGGGDDARANQWAVGYEHALSKRTALYGTFSSVNNNRGARETQTLFSSVGAGYNSGDGYQRSTAVGIRHSF
ncbi:porin [Zoogloea sp.]|uniref:porin n=1 Tax=Zoogloea sp. TaxID=49181 RepID=UPI0035B468E2